MNSRPALFFARLLAMWLTASVAMAQQNAPPPPAPQPPTQTAFSQQELDQMLAPVALYPDNLLSQILMASTYPLEVVEAARWSKANPNLAGDQAVQAVAQENWDPSVKSLVAFPQVLAMMEQKLEWMERLGDAFLSQQAQVMDTVQELRRRAQAAGNLKSTQQVSVDQQGQEIAIEPPNPAVAYVPYYDPTVVYGPWWWPAYPPVFWPIWPGYSYYGGFGWGVGITVGVGFFFGAFDWGHHRVDVLNVNNFYHRSGGAGAWQHDASHRRGVPYRSAALRQQYGRSSQSTEARNAFRGHEAPVSSGASGNRPATERAAVARPQASPNAARTAPRSFEAPAHAFEGVGHGSEVRNFSARGRGSFQRAAPAPGPAGNAHGGGARRR